MNADRIPSHGSVWFVPAAILAFAATIAVASAQPFDLSWHTVDGGGATFSTGGTFELGGTIAQHDASSFSAPMSGGTFQLVGGFWAAAASACTCPGDMNADGQKDGRDIQQFAGCVIAGGACACADVDGVPGVNSADVSVFVADLLAGNACP